MEITRAAIQQLWTSMRITLRPGPTSDTREIVSWLQEVVNKLSAQRDPTRGSAGDGGN